MREPVQLFRARLILRPGLAPAEALVTAGEHILAVGAARELKQAFPTAGAVDLDGVVVTGFNDAHQHIAITADDLLHVDLSAGGRAEP